MFSLRIFLVFFFLLQTKVPSGAERLRGHLCICCFGWSRMWSVGLETAPSDRPAAPREALPGGSDGFKGGGEVQACLQGGARGVAAGSILYFLFRFVFSFIFQPDSFHTLLFFRVFFFLFSFSSRVFCCFHLSFLSSWTEMENRCSDPRGG